METSNKTDQRKPTSINLSQALKAEMEDAARRISYETRSTVNWTDIVHTAVRHYLDHLDVSSEQPEGSEKIDVFVDRDRLKELRSLAKRQGYRSVSEWGAHLFEREISGHGLSLESLDPDEKEIAEAIIRIYRNRSTTDKFEAGMVRFLQYVAGRQRKE